MYVNYINDRQALGFKCLKDIETAKKLNKKGEQIFFIIFSTSVAPSHIQNYILKLKGGSDELTK